MNALALIDKYYPQDNELKHILLTHSRSVADKALWIADRHPELQLDKQFLEEAALLQEVQKICSLSLICFNCRFHIECISYD